MVVTQEGREARVDLRLGRLAVQKGLISPEQLKDALAEQQLGVKRGRKKPRRLGVVLSAKRYMNDDQVLALLEEQESRIVAQDQRRAEDLLLGRVLIDAGFASADAVHECLRLQEAAVQEGGDEIPLLGKLLVERGHATPQVIAEALELQKGVPLICRRCGMQTPSGGVDITLPETCPRCKGPLEPFVPEEPAAPLSAPSKRDSPASEPPHPTRLGKYTIQGLLGRGAMGLVYEALDPQLNRKVALKVILGELNSARPESSKRVELFIQEARLAARLSKHPNIVNVYEADIADGRHYIAMELVRGLTFAEWRKNGTASLRQQVKILQTVAQAVHYAHENGILHRDLKPGNVLVDGEQRPFVTDFGLARAQETEDRFKCGSPLYVSPEQAQGLPGIDRRSDIYSLGVMLYEILEGHPPFRESTRAATLQKVIHAPVPPLTSLGHSRPFSSADREVEAICLKALAKKPGDRHSSAEAFAKELGRWVEKKGSTAEAASDRSTPSFWTPLRIAAAVGILAAVLGGAVALKKSSSPAPPNLDRAQKMMQSGDYAQAFERYDQVLRISEPAQEGKRRGGNSSPRRWPNWTGR